MVATASAPKPHPGRLRVLQPFFNRLRQWNERVPGASQNLPATVLIGTQRLAVDPWERHVISEWSGVQGPPEQTPLLLEVLACVAKTLSDTERLCTDRNPNRDELYRLQAEIMLDSAIGTALLREVRRTVEESVAAGTHRETRRWASLQQRLRQAVSRAMQRLEQSEHQRVHALADTLTDVPAEQHKPESTEDVLKQIERDLERPPAQPRAPVRSPAPDVEPPQPELRPAVPVSLPLRTVALAAVFSISFFLWAGIAWLSRSPAEVALAQPLSDVGRTGLFADPISRHPSLFLEVDGAAWSAMSHQEKWRAVKSASEVASRSDYAGILVRDENDRPLAQWLRGRGIQLLDARPPMANPETGTTRIAIP